MPKIYSPKFFYGTCVMAAGAICAHKDLHVGPTLVAMAMKFRLGAEIGLPTGLFSKCSLWRLEALTVSSVHMTT